MEKLESYQSKRYVLQVPVNYPKREETLSELHLLNVRKALQIILENNLDVFVAKSPEEALQKLGFNFPEKKQKGKWAAAAKRLSTQNTLSPEAGKILEEEGKKFRAGFVLGDNFDNQHQLYRKFVVNSVTKIGRSNDILGGNQNRENQNKTWQVKTKPARSKSTRLVG